MNQRFNCEAFQAWSKSKTEVLKYFPQNIKSLRIQDDYTSLFDFEPVLTVLQKTSLKGSFAQLGAFEDSEIYNNMFAATDINIKDRVKANTEAFAKISEMMSDTYEPDQYRSLTTFLDPKLANKIINNKGITILVITLNKINKSLY